MSKGGLALSSLVMAIPAGVLFYFSLMSVLNMGESMPTLVMAIAWILMALSLVLAISPIIFLVAGPKGAAASPAPVADEKESLPAAAPKKQPAKQESDDDEFSADDGGEVGEDDEQLFDTSNDEAADDFEDNFNFDEDEEIEDEPAPKKKKK